MAVPRRKHSRARKGKRASHQGLRRIGVTYCERCETAKPPHRVCPNCGRYAGRAVIGSEK